MQKKLFSSKDTNLSFRTINHYLDLGLLNKKIGGGVWLRVSGIDLIWIKVIIHLREFGVNLNKIQELKRQIFETGRFGKIDKTNFLTASFEVEIANAIIKRYELNLTIFQDFTYAFQDSQLQKQKNSKQLSKEAYIIIPLFDSIKQTYQLVNNKIK